MVLEYRRIKVHEDSMHFNKTRRTWELQMKTLCARWVPRFQTWVQIHHRVGRLTNYSEEMRSRYSACVRYNTLLVYVQPDLHRSQSPLTGRIKDVFNTNALKCTKYHFVHCFFAA